MALDSINDLSCSSDHARGSSTDLEVVLSYLGAVKHSVERGNLVNLHGLHVEDLSNLVHGREGEEVVVLFLSDEQSRDACALLIVGWVLLE